MIDLEEYINTMSLQAKTAFYGEDLTAEELAARKKAKKPPEEGAMKKKRKECMKTLNERREEAERREKILMDRKCTAKVVPKISVFEANHPSE